MRKVFRWIARGLGLLPKFAVVVQVGRQRSGWEPLVLSWHKTKTEAMRRAKLLRSQRILCDVEPEDTARRWVKM